MVKMKFMIEKCPVKDLGYSQRLILSGKIKALSGKGQ